MDCFVFYQKEYETKIKSSILRKSNQLSAYSIIADYIAINPTLEVPLFEKVSERDRRILTKYRCGSHYLLVNTGRINRITIENRLCECGSIQSLEHVLFNCNITENIRTNTSPANLYEFFNDDTLAPIKLRAMEYLLKIRKADW